MSKKRIQPWIAYPGSTIQQNYSEDLDHGYLIWDIKSRDKFTCEFVELENNKPFISINWENFSKLDKQLKHLKHGSRVRVISETYIPQKDLDTIKKSIKQKINATEVVFKINSKNNSADSIKLNGSVLQRNDIKNVDVITDLLLKFNDDKKFYGYINSSTKLKLEEYIKKYLKGLSEDEINFAKNWEIKKLHFSNLYSYGEDNFVNFENLDGITGILGANRVGKSSIIGALLYSIFNVSDRGPLKNINMINCRKNYCESKVELTIDGNDYLITRNTKKNESKKGVITSPTKVEFFKKEGNSYVDLNGEQRTETDKLIKKMIGTHETFMMTSMSTQNDVNRFISEGSTHRKQILSKFLSLDIFDKLLEFAKEDLNVIKVKLKDINIDSITKNKTKIIEDINLEKDGIEKLEVYIKNAKEKLMEFESVISTFDVSRENEYKDVSRQIEVLNNSIQKNTADITSKKDKIEINKNKINELILKETNFSNEAQERFQSSLKISSIIVSLKKEIESQKKSLDNKKNSIKILNNVPCGTQFPSCTFIKNAHEDKNKLDETISKIDDLNLQLVSLEEEYKKYDADKLKEKLDENKRTTDEKTKYISENSSLEANLQHLINKINEDSLRLQQLQNRKKEILDQFGHPAEELEEIFRKVDDLKDKRNKISSLIEAKESEKTKTLISVALKEKQIIDLDDKNILYNNLSENQKLLEFITYSFSKNGLSAKIINDQLPVINAEIENILAGVVDFTVELSIEDDSNFMEVYINYGDSKRIIELCSGMEKFISSIAIRVALTNVSCLPKTNTFFIDEGFGVLDEAGVDACNRLLLALKKYFKNIVVITHIDSVKEIVNNIIDISKNENDSKVYYS
jgi:DNA repair exonuclease SbcCD ATPase subunit